MPHKKGYLRKLEKDGGVNEKKTAGMNGGKQRHANNNMGPAISVVTCIEWGPTTATKVWGAHKSYGRECAQLYQSFDDNAKLLRHMKETEDCEELQSDLDKMSEWSKWWQMNERNMRNGLAREVVC